MKIIQLFIFSVIVLFISCEDEIPEPDPIDPGPRYTLKAGDAVSDSVDYYEFDPYLKIKGTRNGNGDDYSFHDSTQMDFNNDGLFDIHFEYYMYYRENECNDSLSNDSIVVCCFPDAAAFCRIKTNTGVTVAMEEDQSWSYPKIFKTGDLIDENEDWSSIQSLQNFSMASTGAGWDVNSYNNFMGYRIIISSDTTFGWIRLNTHSSNWIEIYNYVIEK